MSVPKIVEITYAGRDDCAGNMSEEKSTTCQGLIFAEIFAFACTPSLSPREITWLEPAIQ